MSLNECFADQAEEGDRAQGGRWRLPGENPSLEIGLDIFHVDILGVKSDFRNGEGFCLCRTFPLLGFYVCAWNLLIEAVLQQGLERVCIVWHPLNLPSSGSGSERDQRD